jgi:hypothetical protein
MCLINGLLQLTRFAFYHLTQVQKKFTDNKKGNRLSEDMTPQFTSKNAH